MVVHASRLLADIAFVGRLALRTLQNLQRFDVLGVGGLRLAGCAVAARWRRGRCGFGGSLSNEFQRRPFANASMTVPTYRVVPSIDTSLAPAVCGVTTLCGAFTNGSEMDGGSLRSTSRPTARMRPLSRAAFNAGSSTSVPREKIA